MKAKTTSSTKLLRTREIAIRTAVGAGRSQIVRTAFWRASIQLLVGVVLGGLVAVPALWNQAVEGSPRSVVIVASLLLAAGFAACLVPVRRALQIEPAMAIKSE